MSNRPPIFLIKTLGCKANQYDSQLLREHLLDSGFTEYHETGGVDVCIVNTCTVTAQSDAKSRQCIRALKRQHPNARMVVTGCYAEMKPIEAAQIPGVDEIFDNAGKTVLGNRVGAMLGIQISDAGSRDQGISFFSGHTRAFVKIQDGCDKRCSYCIVRYARGSSRSRDIAKVVQEVGRVVANGYREVVLTGIHIGSFGGENGRKPHRLPELIERLEAVGGLLRLRLSSIDPNEISHELIEAMRDSQRMCRHLHVPLQSGSDTILRRMNREYTQEKYLETVALLRKELPGICLSTDAMVGFPGETDADFDKTRRMVAEAGFSKVHIFPFSSRPGTAAHRFPDRVNPRVTRERVTRLSEEAGSSARRIKQQFVGKILDVLVEKASPPNGRSDLPPELRGSAHLHEGFSSGYLRTMFVRRKGAVHNPKNRIARVRTVAFDERFLYGEEV